MGHALGAVLATVQALQRENAALRDIVDSSIKQAGSLVSAERLRFDFNYFEAIPIEELQQIEQVVNHEIMRNTAVETREMALAEVQKDRRIQAVFDDTYGERVRVVGIGDFSQELCGGTHVRNTGDIGKFKIVSQASIAAGVRRVEALRDKQLEDYFKNKEKLLDLSAQKNEEIINDLSEKIVGLGGKPNIDKKNPTEIIKELTKQLDVLTVGSILQDKTKNIISDIEVKGIKVRLQKILGLPPKELRKLVDKGKKDLGEGIVIIFAIKDDKIGLAVGVTDKLIKKYNAVDFAKIGSETIGGKGGGGRPDFAQAGGIESSKIDEAFEKFKSLI